MALMACAAPAVAQTAVRIVETWPPGEDVILGRDQHFYLRLAYDTDAPVRIWARPMYRGKPADAGNNPSQVYQGRGEALGWFFLLQPGAQVDEVQVQAGDGRPGTTRVLATWRGRVSGGGMAALAPEPAWVTRLSASAAASQAAERRSAARQPAAPGDGLLINGFLLAFVGLGLAGIAVPAWAAWRWRGGWRVAAAVPAAGMALVLLGIVVGTAIDPTSHNLWPFEILMWGALCVGAIGALAFARRLLGAGRAHP